MTSVVVARKLKEKTIKRSGLCVRYKTKGFIKKKNFLKKKLFAVNYVLKIHIRDRTTIRDKNEFQ